MPTVQWLPADTSEDADSVTGWGVMPPGAARAAAVSAGAKTVLHSAQLTGMPNGVYAGTAHVSGTSVVLYFLDSAGQVVAAEPWYVNR
jgi:hypothetical protein